MGLLDFNDPIQQFGLGLLAASGPSNRPFSWGNAIASGAGQVMDWQDKQLARQLREQQLQLNKMTIDDHAVSLAQKQLREKLLNSDALPDEIRTRLMLGGSPDKAFEDMAQQAFMKKALPLLGGQEVEAARPYQAEMADSMAAMPDKRFDVSTPEAQQKLQDDFARLEQIDPKQAALVREQLVQQGLIKPKTTITQPDWQRIGQLGVATQLAGVKGGDAMMKLAEMYQPNTMTVDTGNGQLLVNKNTGTPVGLGFLPKGMSPNEVQINARENAKLNFELPGGYRPPSAEAQQWQGATSPNSLSAKQQAEITAKANESVAAKTGNRLDDSFNTASGAVSQIRAGNQIRDALVNNNAFVGPFAEKRLGLAQLGEWMGVNGESTQEKIVNTRSIINGLAQASLNSADKLKGQGSVTENERLLLQQAASGNINNMTAREILKVVEINERIGRLQLASHDKLLKELNGANISTTGYGTPDAPKEYIFPLPQKPRAVDLQKGAIYRNANGGIGRWNGMTFDNVEQ